MHFHNSTEISSIHAKKVASVWSMYQDGISARRVVLTNVLLHICGQKVIEFILIVLTVLGRELLEYDKFVLRESESMCKNKRVTVAHNLCEEVSAYPRATEAT